MADILKDYFEALERLKRRKPERLRPPYKITNDSVSLEAGRKKGTIKRSRPIFSDLIEAIDAAAQAEAKPQDEARERMEQAKAEAAKYRTLWEEALAREVSLVKQLWDEREEWAKEKTALTGAKVTSIRNTRAKKEW